MTSRAAPTSLAFTSSWLDRAGPHRQDPAWLAARLADEATRAVLVRGEEVAVRDDDLALPRLGELGLAPAAADAAVVLGLDPSGAAVVAVDAGAVPVGGAPETFAHVRDAGAWLPAPSAGVAAQAVALLAWHRRHPRCPRCGAATASIEGGYARRCTAPDDGSLHHPRTDPCVIVLVEDGDRVLLGRRAGFPAGRYSILAGFVEPGETLEAAVAREVLEESGVEVDAASVRYVASQPWPFPASLMLGFTARARGGTPHPADGELEDVRWMSRAEVVAGAAAGSLLLPGGVSIAHRLITAWLEAEAPG